MLTCLNNRTWRQYSNRFQTSLSFNLCVSVCFCMSCMLRECLGVIWCFYTALIRFCEGDSFIHCSHQKSYFSENIYCSFTQWCPTLCNPMDGSQASLSLIDSGVCSNSCLLNWWCHPTVSSSVVHFSSCPLSFPAPRSFPGSWFFASGGQSIRNKN